MSEHSKGPELEYDGANGRIFNTAGRILAVVHCDAQPGRLLSEVVRERDALGRKMAAAPELVEWLDDAREWMRRNPPTDGMGGVDHDEERERQRLLELGAMLLKKAGVGP